MLGREILNNQISLVRYLSKEAFESVDFYFGDGLEIADHSVMTLLVDSNVTVVVS